MQDDQQRKLTDWMAALEGRFLADLRVQEVTRALRALSSTYVERRTRGPREQVRGALDSRGKRAAFALYYAPLHCIAVAELVAALGLDRPAPPVIVDLGCGTGAAGAAWAMACGGSPTVSGIDRHPWAVAETRWTLDRLGVHGAARQGDVGRLRALPARASVVAAYTLNELPEAERVHLLRALFDAPRRGGRVLVVEPLATGVVPWWPDAAERVVAHGGRADRWKFPIDPPPLVQRLGSAAGLNYRELRLQSLLL